MAKKRGKPSKEEREIKEEKNLEVLEVKDTANNDTGKPAKTNQLIKLNKLIKDGKAKIYRKDTEVFTQIDKNAKSVVLHDNMLLVLEISGAKSVRLHPAYRFRARAEVFDDVIIIEPRHKVRLNIPVESEIITIEK